MTDIVAQVAKYLAEKTDRTYGTDVFYYQMPDSVDDCVVVQRNKLNVSVPVQIDADVYSIRVAARNTSADAAYAVACEMWNVLLADTDENAGFIQLEETYAKVDLFDKPLWESSDQQGRKVFDFTARLITKRL